MELFKLFGKIAVDNTEANNALEDTTNKANDSANETESAFAKIGGAAKKIALGIGAVGLAVGGAFVGAVEGTREYRAEMGLLEAAFLTAGHSSEEAKRTYSDLNAVLGDSGAAVETSQHLAKIADNEDELTELTDILTGVYAEFGSTIDMPGLGEAILHTSELGEVQGTLADALEWNGTTVDAFNKELAKCANAEERQDLITKKLKETYGKASKQYKVTNADVMEARKAQERLSDAMARVGEIGEPIMTATKNAIAGLAEKAVPVIEKMVNGFRDGVTWIKQNQETVQTWIGVILGAATAIGVFLLILQWGSIMTAAANAIKVVRTAILAMNAAMLANPVALIVALLAGLVVAFLYLWNNVEGFRNFWKSAWSTIKSLASSAGKAIQKALVDAWNGAKKAWSNVSKFFSDIWSNIKKAFSDTKTWFSNLFKSALNGVKSAWNGAKSFFSGIWSGIKGVFSSVGSWFRSTFQKAWSNIKSVFSGWGSFFSGLWSSIKSKFGSIGTSIGTTMGNAVKKGMNGALSLVEGAINKGIGLINSAIRLANKLPGINVGTVGKINLPRLAKGTVVDEATAAVIGEDGAEAVVPLERNTEWIDKVAAQLNNRTDNVSSEAMIKRMNRIIDLLEQLIDRNIYLDSGALVGELAPAMDVRLGRIYSKAKRGMG